jgi:hypothetical protein
VVAVVIHTTLAEVAKAVDHSWCGIDVLPFGVSQSEYHEILFIVYIKAETAIRSDDDTWIGRINHMPLVFSSQGGKGPGS